MLVPNFPSNWENSSTERVYEDVDESMFPFPVILLSNWCFRSTHLTLNC